MKVRSRFALAALFLSLFFFAAPALCSELSVFAKGDPCHVFERPDQTAKVTGVIKRKAAVTATDVGGGWLKIEFAPVRDLKTGDYIEGKGRYIRKSDVTSLDPCKW